MGAFAGLTERGQMARSNTEGALHELYGLPKKFKCIDQAVCGRVMADHRLGVGQFR